SPLPPPPPLFPYTTLFRSRPPARSRASSTTHCTPAQVSAFATVSPAIPAPTTSTRSTGRATPPGTSVRPSSKLPAVNPTPASARSEEHTSELQSRGHLVCR